MTVYHPGPTEIEWLADLKPIAEQVGAQVLGETVRWRVETRITARRNRSDVRVETESGTLLFTGEAKRPDDPAGAHPLVDSEVSDAVHKAATQGSQCCFTTNFHHLALLDARGNLPIEPLIRLQGGMIPFIPESAAKSEGWWLALDNAAREQLASDGLRLLFERFRLSAQGVSQRAPVDEIALSFFSSLTAILLEPLHRVFISQQVVDAPLLERAREAGLNPLDHQDARYLVAQGIAEVLTAALFCRVLRDYFADLDSLLRGTSPRSAGALARLVSDSLDEYVRLSDDYETILVPSAIAEWVLKQAPDHSVRQWVALLGFVDNLDVASISEDVLGSIFERLNSPERRHEMGQHYTQPRLARCMAQWGTGDGDTAVLDPACGAGTFLVETYAHQKRLGLGHDEILACTFGNDLDSFAVHLASINLATRQIRRGVNHPVVRHGDAFDLKPGAPMLAVHPTGGQAMVTKLPVPDLVITNPPYGRSHPDEKAAATSLDGLMAPKAQSSPDMNGGNLAAWFVLLGSALGHEATRLAYVLPIGVLQNDNLRAWRRWIRERYDLVIWHTEHDIWFSDARVASCVVLFTPRRSVKSGTVGSVHFVGAEDRTSGALHYVHGCPSPCAAAEVRDLSQLGPEADLLIPGTKPDALSDYEKSPGVTSVQALTDVEHAAGQKLGHAFFKLKDLEPDSAAVIRRVSGLGLAFQLNRKYLTPLLDSPRQLVEGAPFQLSTWMLTLPEELPRSRAVRDYIAFGETRGVDESPSVASRGAAWWCLNAKPADIAVAMNAQFQHQLAWFEEPGVANNNFNVLRFQNRPRAELVAASLASAFGALSLFYISGEIGCEGARRVLLSQFVHWPVLDALLVPDELAERCVSAYRVFRAFPSYEVDEMAPEALRAWRDLTIAVAAAAALGGSSDSVRLANDAIRECQHTVSRRRLREAIALGGRTRSTRRGMGMARRIRAWCNDSDVCQRCVNHLVAGPVVVRTRSMESMVEMSFFDDAAPFHGDYVREREIGELLDQGFEAAFPDAVNQSDVLDELITGLRSLHSEATDALIGAAPAPDSPVLEMWEKHKSELGAQLLRLLQSDVRERLA